MTQGVEKGGGNVTIREIFLGRTREDSVKKKTKVKAGPIGGAGAGA